jgi:hypothetical protein
MVQFISVQSEESFVARDEYQQKGEIGLEA